MLSVQLGAAVSVPLIGAVGPGGTAWLRLSIAGLVFLAVGRPPLRSMRWRDLPTLLGLGVTTGAMSIFFLTAIERIPLGTAVAVQFLGPLSVAAARSPTRRALAWPLLALVGVILMTQPWRGDFDLVGVGLAAVAALGWATYILLTRRVGDRFTGMGVLSVTVPVGAVTAAVIGVPQASGHLTVEIIAAAAGVALLMPVVPFALELLALRRMTPTAFGTLTALEPAIGVLLGLVVLHQTLTAGALLGISLVVLAGTCAQRTGPG
jgi:inner membrane transporter RhtA